MEEEKPVVTEIPPLRWPGGSKPQPNVFFTLDPYKPLYEALNIIEKDIVARPPIPPEVWGPDPRRQRMGAFISELFGDICEWSTGRFIPDDPFDIVFSPRGPLAGDADEEIIEKIEKEILCDLNAPKGTRNASSGTLGDFVDYCLSLASVWPIEKWSPDPTGNICQSFTAFYDIRRFMCSRYSLNRKAVSPTTKPFKEFPRLSRGGMRSLTEPGVHRRNSKT